MEDDLTRFQRLLLAPDPALDGCRLVTGRLFFTGLGGANKEQRFPMKRMKKARACERESKKSLGFMELERERESDVGIQVKVVARKWNGEAGNFSVAFLLQPL